jgi:hypothetical protein
MRPHRAVFSQAQVRDARRTEIPLPTPEHLGDCKEERAKSDMAPLLRDVKHPEEADHEVGEHGEVVDLDKEQDQLAFKLAQSLVPLT